MSLSLIDGFSFVDRISWDSYNESGDLIGQIKKYHVRFGFYPEFVHADHISVLTVPIILIREVAP